MTRPRLRASTVPPVDRRLTVPIKKKRKGSRLEIKAFTGNDGNAYLVFRTAKNSFHVFMEVEAKEAARQCGATRGKNTRRLWESVWER